MSNLIAIAAAEARTEAARHTTLEDRLRAAMRSAKDSGWVHTDNDKVHAAVIAVLELTEDETDQQRLKGEMRALNALAKGGVGLAAVLGEMGDLPPIGIHQMWREVARETPAQLRARAEVERLERELAAAQERIKESD